ncbi:hypothetical protein COOONC_22830 [Cooperia oncophora]
MGHDPRAPFQPQQPSHLLRRQRQLEKKQRAEVMKERQRAQMAKPKLLASAREPFRAPVAESSFEMFCSRVKEQYVKYQEEKDSEVNNLGAVVPLRDPPELWRAKVDYHTALLRNFDTTFKYDVYKEAGRRQEVAVEADLEAHTAGPLSSELEVLPEAEIDQVKGDEAHVEEYHDQRLPSSSPNGACEENRQKREESQTNDEIEPAVQNSEEEDPVSTSEEEFASSDESESVTDQSSEEDSDSEDGSSFDEEEEQLSRFAEAYRKNVDFYIVFSSYLSLLKRRYH